jgi:hypothetical protein
MAAATRCCRLPWRQPWRASSLYGKTRAGFETFWDEGRGSYIDHIVDGVRRAEMSQLGGALAIIAGLEPHRRHHYCLC